MGIPMYVVLATTVFTKEKMEAEQSYGIHLLSEEFVKQIHQILKRADSTEKVWSALFIQ